MSRRGWPAPPAWPPPPPPMPPPSPPIRLAPPLPAGPPAFRPFSAWPAAPSFRGYAPLSASGFAPPFHLRAHPPAAPFPPLPPSRGASTGFAAPPDPDEVWLEQFKQAHLQTGPKREREPPLRRLAAMKARAEPLLARLQALAADALAVDARIAGLEAAGVGPAAPSAALDLSRLKAQREQRLAACERVKAELDAMHAPTLFVPPEQLPRLRAFMRRVEKKKAYRRDRKRRMRHEASVRRAAKAAVEPPSEQAATEAAPTHAAVLTPRSSSVEPDAEPSDARAPRPDERERVQRLLLLLDIKEQRLTGAEPAEVADAIRRDRSMLRRALRTRQQHRRAAPSPPPDADESACEQQQQQQQPAADAPAPIKQEVQSSASTAASTGDDPLTFESLVTRRRAWDRFLVAPHTPGASRIPPHWVVPPAHARPDSPWTALAVSETSG